MYIQHIAFQLYGLRWSNYNYHIYVFTHLYTCLLYAGPCIIGAYIFMAYAGHTISCICLHPVRVFPLRLPLTLRPDQFQPGATKPLTLPSGYGYSV